MRKKHANRPIAPNQPITDKSEISTQKSPTIHQSQIAQSGIC
jgi:hypothetical protein